MIMLNTYKAFFGDTVEMTDGVELTWMRQPHYYMDCTHIRTLLD